ncbi:family 43 glycosylhydrolase [Aquihabitans sp. G128]|uniref:family 43 glycosylhydrolase n=1 Tax=Aquihabitans sp. G128 TaxID=2849779 RepID=UPI001C21644E|nr:family 43 glycosylhydrolase [Aquihabitans sp. G128]QXC59484.1 family 43 glycosylhydrolase [Aquihabitans sp. G128]
MLTSTDLVTWKVHARWSTSGPPGRAGYAVRNDDGIPAEIRGLANMGAGTYTDTDWGRYDNNDAQARVSSWGLLQSQGPWIKRTVWAPGVAQLGSTWFSYSAVRTSTSSDDPNGFGRFCITMATATSPSGPFRDVSGTGPVQCQSTSADPAGSIDPFPFVDTNGGANYLLWKAAGKRALAGVTNPHPSAIYAAPIGSNGKLVAGKAPVKLLETREGGWEGFTIENGSMIRYNGRYYLFYSGNYSGVDDASGHSRYATGYAICPSGPRAACVRQTVNGPLLGSTSTEYGPGGATPFVDTAGKLRLAYAFFWPGENRTDQGAAEHQHHPRRLNIATLSVAADGKLTAVRRAWKAQ